MMSILTVLLFLMLPVLAAEKLETIEVTAEKDIDAYTFTQTEKLEKEEIDRAPLPLASQALERVSGIVSSQNGGPGGRTTFFIRGTEARHISFTLDGLKLNDTSNTDRQFDAAFLTLTGIQEIAVHKGPQAVLYGSDALGGHIEMVTRKGSPDREKKLTLTGGSFGTAGIAYRQDWEKGTVSLVRQRTDGISRFNKKRYNATERDGSEITQLMSSSRHEWKENLCTDVLASFIEGRNELDASGDSRSERSRNHQYLLQQKSTYRFRKDTAFSLRNGLNRNERRINTDYSKQNFSGNLVQNELLWEEGVEDARVVTGISLEDESLQLSEKRAFTVGSVFSQGLLKKGDFSFRGGVRGDHHSRYGKFFTSSAGISHDSFLGTFSFQYGRGYKAPSLYQLYGPPLTFYPVVGNRDLKPEINRSYELLWKKKFSSWEFQNVFFQNRLSNLIIFTNTDGYRNQGRFIAEGVEPSVKYTGKSGEVNASFTHQRFRETQTTVLRRPYNYGQLRGSLFVGDAHEVYAAARWFASRKDSFGGNTTKLNAFETFDVGGVYRWKNQEFSLQLVNIMDRDYEEIAGFSVMPRSVFGSYGVKF